MLNSEDLYRQIGARIRRIREMQIPAMSQARLAQVLGLQRTSITNIESGEQKITLDAVYRLCEHFKLELGEVLPRVGDLAKHHDRTMVIGGKAQDVPVKTARVLERYLPAKGHRR